MEKAERTLDPEFFLYQLPGDDNPTGMHARRHKWKFAN